MVTYDGAPFVVSDLKLLMDQFHRVEFTGTWPKLFSRVKKHIIWGVLKSVTGMQVDNFIFIFLLMALSFNKALCICHKKENIMINHKN